MYSFSVSTTLSYEDAKKVVTEELSKEGFGILTEIDVKAVMKNKLDHDRSPYVILGACNPNLAKQAIEAEPDIGLLLPCNVVIREDDGRTTVAFMDPKSVLSLTDASGIETLATEVRSRLERVRDALPT